MNHLSPKWLISLVALSINLTSFAYDSVVLWLKDGSSVIIPFSKNPQIGFKDDQIEINNRIFPFNEVSKYTIGGSSSIDLIDADGNDVEINENGDVVICSQIKATDISVYGTDGMRYECPVTTIGSNRLKISLGELAPQIYIIKAGSITFKMRKS